jgi:hypothetical protein
MNSQLKFAGDFLYIFDSIHLYSEFLVNGPCRRNVGVAFLVQCFQIALLYNCFNVLLYILILLSVV